MKQNRIDYFSIIIYALSILPFLGMAGIKAVVPSGIYQLWQVAGICLLAVWLFKRDVMLFDTFTTYYILYLCEVFITTCIHSEVNLGILTSTVFAILVIMLIQNDRINILWGVELVLVACTFLNLISLLLKSGSRTVDSVYFIGGKNRLSMILIPAVFLLFVLNEEMHGMFQKYLPTYMIICLFSVLFAGSGAGFVVSVLSFFIIILIDRIGFPKRLMLMMILGISMLIIFSKYTLELNPLWIKLTKSLGKDPTLTYRTTVWSGSAALFLNHPILGIGRIFSVSYVDKYNVLHTVEEAHNFVIQLLCDGGIIGTIFFSKAFFSVMQNLNMRNKIQKLLFSMIFVFLLNGLAEAINHGTLFMLFLALANSYSVAYFRNGRKRREMVCV